MHFDKLTVLEPLPYSEPDILWSAQAVLALSHDKSGAWILHTKGYFGMRKL